MSRGYSTPCAREIGHEMRKRREQAKLKSSELARGLGWAPSKLSRIEAGLYPVSDVELSYYLGWCRVPPEEAEYIAALKKIDDRDPGVWTRDNDTAPLSPALRSLAYHESTALLSTTYEPDVIPGLLQTEDYVRALLRSLDESDRLLSARLRARMDRKTILDRPRPGEFVFFIHENVLRQPIGNTAVMHDQLLHLMFTARRSNILIRVIPASSGVQSICRGSFLLLEYTKEHRPLVFIDSNVASLFIDDVEYVTRYRRLLPTLANMALSEGQSVELFATLAGDFDRAEGIADADLEEEQLQ